MLVNKCDICNETLKKDTRSVHIGIGGYFSNHIEICEKCAEPVLKFLENKKLIGENGK